MLSAITCGQSQITNLAGNADVTATRECLTAMGIEFTHTSSDTYFCEGGALHPPASTLNAKNSGTTIRLLSGILAAQSFPSVISGDHSLNKRPMGRIMTPLNQMGASIEGTRLNETDATLLCPPLQIKPSSTGIQGIDYQSPMASAQVKSAILLAGLYAKHKTSVQEPQPSRDHTERMLRCAGADISVTNGIITLQGDQLSSLKPQHWIVPGDFSSAAFWIVGALCTPNSTISLTNVSLNPFRTGLLQLLEPLTPDCIEIQNQTERNGEPVGNIQVTAPKFTLSGVINVDKTQLPSLIDEIPILAVLAACTDCVLHVSEASELRHKESDRIQALMTTLAPLGVAITEHPDGLTVDGSKTNHTQLITPSDALPTYGDHRIAMALKILNAITQPKTKWPLETPECIAVSYPQFNDVLTDLTCRS